LTVRVPLRWLSLSALAAGADSVSLSAQRRRFPSSTMADDDEAPQLVDDDAVIAAPIVPAAVVQPAVAAAPVAAAPAAAEPSPAPPVPLSILTGWLGAGKTTLLHRILAHFGSLGQQVAIVQNEASSFGVEAGLRLNNNEPSADTGPDGVFNDLLEFSNGCVCCAVKSDFVLGVEALLARKRFDYIVLECSGLADPGPLANMFWVDPELESSVYLDGIISLVDARNFLAHLRPPPAVGAAAADGQVPGDAGSLEAQQVIHQVAYADRIVLNKLDLVSAAEVAECQRQIARINASAPVLTAIRSDVPMERILNIKAFDVNDTSRALAVPPPLEAVDGPAASSTSAVAAHPHDASIRTFMVDDVGTPPTQRKRVSSDKLKRWMEELLWRDAIEPEGQTQTEEGEAAEASAAPNGSSASVASPPVAKTRAEAASAPARSDDMRPNSLFRVKAILHMQPSAAANAAEDSAKPAAKESDPPMFLQAVQELYDLQPGVEWAADARAQAAWPLADSASEEERRAAQRFTRFVFIGRRLDQQLLRDGFASIFVD